uniref:SWIM-type domain-containing protein n=1 Tax=Arundo donax TaxID=35708 RepID=A0A0A9BI17_ARUDO
MYEVFKYDEHAKMEFRMRKYLVLVDLPTENYPCICCKFEKDGILCVHILRVLLLLQQNKILLLL